MKTILAIDPGFNGGLCLMQKTAASFFILGKCTMPLTGDGKGKTIDVSAIKKFVLSISESTTYSDIIDEVWIEKVGAMPGQGVTSMFTFGYNAGMLEGMFLALGIPVHFVRPQQWQKILQGYGHDKKPSQIFCSRMFPNEDWRASDRCRTPHDGMTDAACIGVWSLSQ